MKLRWIKCREQPMLALLCKQFFFENVLFYHSCSHYYTQKNPKSGTGLTLRKCTVLCLFSWKSWDILHYRNIYVYVIYSTDYTYSRRDVAIVRVWDAFIYTCILHIQCMLLKFTRNILISKRVPYFWVLSLPTVRYI